MKSKCDICKRKLILKCPNEWDKYDERAFNLGEKVGKEQREKETDELIDEIIEHRNSERKNNNIFLREADDLNEDFIDELERLKSRIKVGENKWLN